jgi:hypothetical protein
MDRFPRWTLCVLCALAILPGTGCAASGLAAMMWVVKGTDIEAEYAGMKGKKVAVVCQPPASMVYATSSASKELAVEVGRLLKANGKKIEIVDPREIAKWTDTHTYEDPTEVGKAVDADMVLAIELDDFKLYEGQTLYRGKANVVLKVYDLKKGSEPVWEKFPPQSIYPASTGVPTTDKQEAYFRREFIRVLADEIGRYFYAHDSRAFFAADSAAFK